MDNKTNTPNINDKKQIIEPSPVDEIPQLIAELKILVDKIEKKLKAKNLHKNEPPS